MGTRVLLRTRPRTARPKPLAGQRSQPADESGKRAGRPLDARRKARVHSPLRHDGDDRNSRQLRHRSIRRCAGLSFQEVQRRRGPQRGGFPVRVSRCRLATSRLGWHADNGLRKGDGRGGSQRPGEGALPPRPPAADLVARRTPYDLRRWESAAQALLVRRNATLTIERRSDGAGARPESIGTAPAVTSTPLGATVRGGTWGAVSRQGSRPHWPDTK
jgi:hypothetical protein